MKTYDHLISWLFPGIVPEYDRNIPGHSRNGPGDFPELVRTSSGNFPGRISEIYRKNLGHLPELFRTFPGIGPGNYRKFCRTFQRHLPEISRICSGHDPGSSRTFPRIAAGISRICSGNGTGSFLTFPGIAAGVSWMRSGNVTEISPDIARNCSGHFPDFFRKCPVSREPKAVLKILPLRPGKTPRQNPRTKTIGQKA